VQGAFFVGEGAGCRGLLCCCLLFQNSTLTWILMAA
jgi:hypothetical protein